MDDKIELFYRDIINYLEHLKVKKFKKEKQKFFGKMTKASRGYIDGVNACLSKVKKGYKAYTKNKHGFYD